VLELELECGLKGHYDNLHFQIVIVKPELLQKTIAGAQKAISSQVFQHFHVGQGHLEITLR
jgi:hypothetical protein